MITRLCIGLMQNEQLEARSHLQVETDLRALEKVLQWFESFALPFIPQQLGWEFQLALTEGFTNAVRHGHQGLPSTTPIELEVKVFRDYLEMRVWDRGEIFDWEATLQSTDHEDYDPLDKPGGRGLMLIKQITDEFDFTFQPNQGKCLIMRKRIT